MGECDTETHYYLIARNSQNKPFQFVNFTGKDIGNDKIPASCSYREVLEYSRRLQSRGYETCVVKEVNSGPDRFITLEELVIGDETA